MTPLSDTYDIALVLGGGNALGSYQAGAYQALYEAGIEPDWVVGASIGAINGAIIAGTPVDRRIAHLRALWEPSPDVPGAAFEDTRRTAAATWTMATGRAGMFVPRNLLGPWWNPFGDSAPSSLFDSHPMVETLERLIDFDLLNDGPVRFSATAVDIETGDDIVFDTATHRITPLHLRATSALLPAFAPVEVGGRMLGDAGISLNLPVDLVLGDIPKRPLLCIALDLLPLHAPRPASLGETILRLQDLMFATQSRRAIAAWQAIFDARAAGGDPRSATVIHLAYRDQDREVSGKAFDFSAGTAAQRWASGYDDVSAAITSFGTLAAPGPGLTFHARAGTDVLQRTNWQLAPITG